MRKKILIIAAVAGLDLAYIFLMGGGLELTEISKLEEPVAPAQPYIVLKPESSEPPLAETTTDEHEIAARITTGSTARPRFEAADLPKASGREKTFRRTQPATAANESKAKLADTIIWVNTPAAIRSTANDSYQVMHADLERKVEPREEPRKRTFTSVVKKPYEWIKALATKLK